MERVGRTELRGISLALKAGCRLEGTIEGNGIRVITLNSKFCDIRTEGDTVESALVFANEDYERVSIGLRKIARPKPIVGKSPSSGSYLDVWLHRTGQRGFKAWFESETEREADRILIELYRSKNFLLGMLPALHANPIGIGPTFTDAVKYLCCTH